MSNISENIPDDLGAERARVWPRTRFNVVPKTYEFGPVKFIGIPGIASSVNVWIQLIESRLLADEEPNEISFYIKDLGDAGSELFFGASYSDDEYVCGGLHEGSRREADGILVAFQYIQGLGVAIDVAMEKYTAEFLYEKIKLHFGQMDKMDGDAFKLSLLSGKRLIEELFGSRS